MSTKIPRQTWKIGIENLLAQMTLDEKTCQMVTLYGYLRVLQDDLPTPEWKTKLWKDGIGAIDEHLNGFRGWGVPVYESPYLWPASKHAWALNEVQRFFVEETRLGIPADLTNERLAVSRLIGRPISRPSSGWGIPGTVS